MPFRLFKFDLGIISNNMTNINFEEFYGGMQGTKEQYDKFSIVMDMKTGEKLSLFDFFDVSEEFIMAVAQPQYGASENVESLNIDNDYFLKNFELITEDSFATDENPADNNYYFSEMDSVIYLNISFGLQKVVGYYADYSIPIEDIQEYWI